MKLKIRAVRAAENAEEQKGITPPDTEVEEPYMVFATKEEYDKALADAIAEAEGDRAGDTK